MIATLLLSVSSAVSQTTTIDFEHLPGMTFWSGNAVPEASRLSSQLLDSHGVKFSSASAPYVAVVALGEGHATSGTNGIGGVASDGSLSYAEPIRVEFFLPHDSTTPATTDLVSIRNDLLADGGESVAIEAYGIDGALLTSNTLVDDHPFTLSVSAVGIHAVRISEGQSSGAAAFDDLSFNTLVEARPLLHIGAVSSMVRLSWSTNFSGYSLEQAEALVAPDYVTVTNIVDVSGGMFSVLLESTASGHFYRLRRNDK
jgi:hypothetical protein